GRRGAPGDARGPARPRLPDRVPAAAAPHGEHRPGGVQGGDPRPGVALRLRRRRQHRRHLHLLPAAQGRHRGAQAHPHHPRRGLRDAGAGAVIRPMRRFSLRSRLLLLTSGLLLVGLGLISAVLSNRLESHLVDRLDGQLRSLATIATMLPAQGGVDAESLDAVPGVAGPALDVFGAPSLVLLDGDGRVLTAIHSSRRGGRSLPPPSELRRVPAGGDPVTLASADGSERWRAVGVRARDRDGGRDGTAIAAASLAGVDATTANLRTTGLVGGAALLALLTAAGWFALRGGLRPLRTVEDTAAAVASGDLGRRVPELAPPGTEIGRLSGALNTMLGQLERAFAERAASEERMREFVSDVSHELRTPLFGIKGSTELYRMGALTGPADVDATMHRIEREAARLTALTEDLLLLARLDQAPGAALEPAPMDLRTLAGDARHDLRALDRS